MGEIYASSISLFLPSFPLFPKPIFLHSKKDTEYLNFTKTWLISSSIWALIQKFGQMKICLSLPEGVSLAVSSPGLLWWSLVASPVRLPHDPKWLLGTHSSAKKKEGQAPPS